MALCGWAGATLSETMAAVDAPHDEIARAWAALIESGELVKTDRSRTPGPSAVYVLREELDK